MLQRCRREISLLSLLLIVPLLGHATGGCKLGQLASVPITMDGLRPTVESQINGSPALLALDSGAFWSMLTPAAAQQYQLRVDHSRVQGMYIRGVGGATEVGLTTVKIFTIFNVPVRNVDFLVGGSEPGRGTVGILGQNILRVADIEYDLAKGTMALFRPEDCRHVDLAYWVKAGEPYNALEIEATTPQEPHTTGMVDLNGAKIRVIFDTGATTSMVGLRAAAAAGLKPGDPRVEPAGYTTGVGSKPVQTWIATFPVLKIGDEEVRNARLRFGDLGTFGMLLGADFFLSHRVYVANSQHKLYFTYNGGPVFALNARKNLPAAAEKGAAASDTASADTSTNAAESSPDLAAGKASSAPAEASDDSPADAGELARRAAASAARRDFDHALQDFNRAVELSPATASYYYQRGMVEFQLRQTEPGASDIDKAITLNPGYIEALVVRAQYRRSKRDTSGALADLDTVDRLAPKQSDVRLTLAMLYGSLNHPAQVISQMNLWIPDHDQDPRVVAAYNDRCWSRALLGQELDEALHDCNAGLRLNAHSADILDSRGLVNLRRNQLDKAIADYDESLKINPKKAWSLYGRGIAELRKRLTAKGEADVDAAKALAPNLPGLALQYGVSP